MNLPFTQKALPITLLTVTMTLPLGCFDYDTSDLPPRPDGGDTESETESETVICSEGGTSVKGECAPVGTCNDDSDSCDDGYKCVSNNFGEFSCEEIDHCEDGTHECATGYECVFTNPGEYGCNFECENGYYDGNNALCWETTPTPATKTFYSAVAYCSNSTADGYDDWRIPSIDELRTLIVGCTSTLPGGNCAYVEDDVCGHEWNSNCNDCAANAGPINGTYWRLGEQGVGGNYWADHTISCCECSYDVKSTIDFNSGRIWGYMIDQEHKIRCVRKEAPTP